MTVKEIRALLEGTPHIMVDNELVREIGLKQAIVHAALVRESEEAGNEEFACRVVDLEYVTGLSGSRQKKILEDLQDKGYIKITYKGLPRCRFIELLK